MKLALVGEAYGAEEALYQKPFVGPSGQELNRMLSDAGLVRDRVALVSNVFNFQPSGNDISTLCTEKTSAGSFREWGPLVKGGYLREEYAVEINRLRAELIACKPNVVVALGNTASWALTQQTAISKIRGTVSTSTLIDGLKVLPTYHPAAVLREYSLRHVTVLDLIKAKHEAEFPEIRRPLRTIYYRPDLNDLESFYWPRLCNASHLSVDIETANGQMTCIGFAPSITEAFVIPFWATTRGGNYWTSQQEELAALAFIRRVLLLPMPKVFQNGLYDMQYLWMKYGLSVHNAAEDTMLLHHSLHPESEKGLGFLGSVYTNMPNWKDMRSRGPKTIKRED